MGRKRKPFIEKGKAQRYFLTHGEKFADIFDGNSAITKEEEEEIDLPSHAPALSLIEPAGPNPNERKKTNKKAVTIDDLLSKPDHVTSMGHVNTGYDYDKHYKTMGNGVYIGADGTITKDATKISGIQEEEDDDDVEDDSQSIMTSATGLTWNTNKTKKNKKKKSKVDIVELEAERLGREIAKEAALTISAECMDEDLKAALFDDADEEGEFELLDNDFISQVIVGNGQIDGGTSSIHESINTDNNNIDVTDEMYNNTKGFDWEAHMKYLITRSEGEIKSKARGWGDDDDDDEDDESGEFDIDLSELGLSEQDAAAFISNQNSNESSKSKNNKKWNSLANIGIPVKGAYSNGDVDTAYGSSRWGGSIASTANPQFVEDQFNEIIDDYDDDDIGYGRDEENEENEDNEDNEENDNESSHDVNNYYSSTGIDITNSSVLDAALDDFIQAREDERMKVGISITDEEIANNKFLYVKGARDLSHLEHINKTGDNLLHEAREALTNMSIQDKNNYQNNDLNSEKEITQLRLAEALQEKYAQEITESVGRDYSELEKCQEYLREGLEREPEQWDCESILSTYSTLDNHPTVIGAPTGGNSKGKRKNRLDRERNSRNSDTSTLSRIMLTSKLGIPRGYGAASTAKGVPQQGRVDMNDKALDIQMSKDTKAAKKLQIKNQIQISSNSNSNSSSSSGPSRYFLKTVQENEEMELDSLGSDEIEENFDDELQEGKDDWEDDELFKNKNKKVKETSEEKKARKAAVKEERRQKRAQKKGLKDAYRSEGLNILRGHALKQDIDGTSVFRY